MGFTVILQEFLPELGAPLERYTHSLINQWFRLRLLLRKNRNLVREYVVNTGVPPIYLSSEVRYDEALYEHRTPKRRLIYQRTRNE